MNQITDLDVESLSMTSEDSYVDLEDETSLQISKHLSSEYKEIIKLIEPTRVPSGSPNFNFLDKRVGTWVITKREQSRLFELLESCRRQNVSMHFQERQKGSKTGFMFDLDIDHMSEITIIDDSLMQQIVMQIMLILPDCINIKNKYQTIVGVIKSKEPRWKSEKECFRESIHVLIPGVRVDSSVKVYIMNKIKNEKCLDELFDEFTGDSKVLNPVLDTNSATVPVHFIGSVKHDTTKKPDTLEKVYKITYSRKVPLLEDYTIDFLKQDLNVCLEFSLSFSSSNNYITRTEFEPLPAIAGNLPKVLNLENYTSTLDEVNKLNNDISKNPNVKYLYLLLETINVHRAENREDWKKIVGYIRAVGEQYKFLAIHFSKKAPAKFDQRGFDDMWDYFSRNNSISSCEALGILAGYARVDNPVKYIDVSKQSIQNIMQHIICGGNSNGVLTDHDYSLLLQRLVSTIYKCVKIDKKRTIWYKFVFPGESCKPGQIFKYRELGDIPYSLDNYICVTFKSHLESLMVYFNKQIEKEEAAIIGKKKTKSQSLKYYNNVKKAISKNITKVCNNSGTKHIISKFESKLMDEQANINFATELDSTPNIIGVGNGVLLLTELDEISGNKILKCELLQRFHNYPITKYTSVNYIPYDPEDPIIQEVECFIRELFPDSETDAYEYMMLYMCGSLDYNEKGPMLLSIEGSGSNGKTLLAEAVRFALGKDYSGVSPGSLLTEKPGGAESSNSALMELKNRRLNVFDEFPVDAVLQDEMLKKITSSEMSARGLYTSQEQFYIFGVNLTLSNYPINLAASDYGTKRRISYYRFKMEFLNKNDERKPYDPTNPLHRVRDESLKKKIKTPRYKEAMLSILVKWYAILYIKYNGELSNVPNPTISEETNRYLESQDTMTRFINNRMVKHVNPEFQMLLSDAIQVFRDFCDDKDPHKKDKSVTIADQFKTNQYIKSNNLIIIVDKLEYLVGHRVLKNGTTRDKDEVFVSDLFVQNNQKVRCKFRSANFTNMTIGDYIMMHIGQYKNPEKITAASHYIPPKLDPFYDILYVDNKESDNESDESDESDNESDESDNESDESDNESDESDNESDESDA